MDCVDVDVDGVLHSLAVEPGCRGVGVKIAIVLCDCWSSTLLHSVRCGV